MRIGLIGVGTVGGTLRKYLEEKTTHNLSLKDPDKGMNDSFAGVDAVFISVPVPTKEAGQDISALLDAANYAQKHTKAVFVRSTVLPGTNDKLGTISMPEFLTERRAFEDFCNLPIIVGGRRGVSITENNVNLISKIFPEKEIKCVSNVEAELAKFTHNCFGAMKVTYFNIIKSIADKVGADFNIVKHCSMMTGFIEPEHTMVPGPDGLYGYGGKCFPENIDAMISFLKDKNVEYVFFKEIRNLNNLYRSKISSEK